jgi:membrane protein YdbS with pleckstrin-like domain
MMPLEPGQLWVMRIHGAIAALVVLALAAAAEPAVAALSDDALPRGAILGVALLAILYPCLIAPGRRYRAWRYRIEPDTLHLGHGVLTQVQTAVPFVRVQHIDVAQGPIERAFGVGRLMLHTAGTAHSLVVLPGLSMVTAEQLRDDIRAKLRADPA